MRRKGITKASAVMTVALGLLFFTTTLAGTAVAQQAEGDTERVRDRKQTRDSAQEPQGETLRERIRDRIENDQGLREQDRERLRKHLGECKQLGLDDELIAALFDEAQPLEKQIRIQERALAMTREGLPVEPVVRKLQEGRRKGANEETLERVCERMEEHVRTAHRFMQRAREDGVTPGNEEAERRRTREMAMHMWRGLNEEDMDQLRERARLRLRDGSCTTEELAAAAETVSKLREMGVDRTRSLRLAGGALQNGYSAGEMRQLRWMVMTAYMHGGGHEEVLETLERGIRNQHQLSQMVQQMWQHGWMGPADQHGGRGGQGPADHAPGSGPGGQGSGEKKKGGGGNDGGGNRRGGQ